MGVDITSVTSELGFIPDLRSSVQEYSRDLFELFSLQDGSQISMQREINELQENFIEKLTLIIEGVLW